MDLGISRAPKMQPSAIGRSWSVDEGPLARNASGRGSQTVLTPELAAPDRVSVGPSVRRALKMAGAVLLVLIALVAGVRGYGLLTHHTASVEVHATFRPGSGGRYTATVTNHLKSAVTEWCLVTARDPADSHRVASDDFRAGPIAPGATAQVNGRLLALPGQPSKVKPSVGLETACQSLNPPAAGG